MAALKVQLADVKQDLVEARAVVGALTAQLNEVLEVGREDAVRLDQLRADRDRWIERFEAIQPAAPLSRWQHLRAFFTGREV
ncbi:hypothetical protein D3C84_1139730 [compost metagenome]